MRKIPDGRNTKFQEPNQQSIREFQLLDKENGQIFQIIFKKKIQKFLRKYQKAQPDFNRIIYKHQPRTLNKYFNASQQLSQQTFPSKKPIIINPLQPQSEMNSYHAMVDSNSNLHMVELNKPQELLLQCYYRDRDQNITLVQSNWEQYIQNVRGSQFINPESSSVSDNEEIIERLDQVQLVDQQLHQSEVQIIEQSSSPQKKVNNGSHQSQQNSLVDQLNNQEILSLIQEEVPQAKSQIKQFVDKKQEMPSIINFLTFWQSIRVKNQFNEQKDNKDTGRDYHKQFNMIGQKDLFNRYGEKEYPTQMQILYVYLNYQREQIFSQGIGQDKQSYMRSRESLMEGKFRKWLQNDKDKIWKLYDIANWDDQALIKFEALKHKDKIDNLFLAGSKFIGYRHYPDHGSRQCLVLVTRELIEDGWVCEIGSEESQTLFAKQFCLYIFPTTHHLNYIAPNWSGGLVVCPFCQILTTWFNGLEHYCKNKTSDDLIKQILSSVNIE